MVRFINKDTVKNIIKLTKRSSSDTASASDMAPAAKRPSRPAAGPKRKPAPKRKPSPQARTEQAPRADKKPIEQKAQAGKKPARRKKSDAPARDSETPKAKPARRGRMGRKKLQPVTDGEQRAPEEKGADPKASGPKTRESAAPRKSSSRRRRPRKPPERTAPKRSEAPDQEMLAAQHAAWDPASFAVEPIEGKKRFHEFNLPSQVMHAIADLGWTHCTPIQAEILQALLDNRDAGGQAQTGTGKTAAFLINIFTKLLSQTPEPPLANGTPRALIIAPTRELVVQLERDAALLGKYSGMNTLAVYGGLDYEKQRRYLQENRVDVIAATPGRLIDYLNSRYVHLGHVEVLVLDEADRMLDMGFIPDVRRIVRATPPRDSRQTMLFSATLKEQVSTLAAQWMKNDPVRVEIEPESVAADTVDQIVYITTAKEKFNLLYNLLQKHQPERAILFVNRRDAAERLADDLERRGISCAVLSGAIAQNKRMKTLDRFRSGEQKLIVATDVAGRGLHIEGVSHIFNYNTPHDPEDYVHRIGRTGRAGASGTAITFACDEESFYLVDVEEYLGHALEYSHPEPELLVEAPKPTRPRKPRPPRSGSRSGSRSSGGGRRGGSRPPRRR